ncbi:MAG: zinc-ribbon domain-containing protein [Promethearchaeota archaeon]
MRTCPKCGRANQPTRKYCIRCGALLLSVETKPKTIAAPPETPATPQPKAETAPPPVSSASEARVTTNDQWVKPSQVSKDRVRTADGTTKPKSEMEKAMEAFAKADKVGIEEEGEGIIETRMLRASEVQELMGEMEAQREATMAPPSTPPPTAAPSTPPPLAQPPGAPQSPAQSPTPAKPEPAAPVQPPPAMAPAPKPKPASPPPMPRVAAKAPTPTPPPEKRAASIPEITSILSSFPDQAYRQDPQIIGIVNDLKNLYTELAQFNSDLDNIRVRLESEVQDYWNVAEVKRIQFESLEEQLRLAKHEWNDSTKIYQQAEKRMKNEISSREKRIKDIQKRIEKAEGGIGKRVKDLDKEKEKQAQSG